MAKCCARLSKVYMLTTNLLFACLGFAFIAFGALGYKNHFKGAILFPTFAFEYVVVLGIVVILAAIIGLVAAFKRKRPLFYVYLLVVLVALVLQVVVGVKVYQKAANPSQYIAPIWSEASSAYRSQLQQQFSCCGYNNAMDNPAITDKCNPQSGVMSMPCYDPLKTYVHSAFSKTYLVLFAALAMEVLALSNGITMICTQHIQPGGDEEDERRRRRKSGIKLDDMSPDTPTTAGSYNHFGNHTDEGKYYAGYAKY